MIDPQWILTAAHCVTQYKEDAKVTQSTSLKLTDIAPGSLVVREGVWRLEGSNAGRVIEVHRSSTTRITQLQGCRTATPYSPMTLHSCDLRSRPRLRGRC